MMSALAVMSAASRAVALPKGAPQRHERQRLGRALGGYGVSSARAGKERAAQSTAQMNSAS